MSTQAEQPRNRRPRRDPPTTQRKLFNTPGFWAILAVVILLVAFAQVVVASQPDPTGQRINFSSFVNLAENGKIKSARILDEDAYVEGQYEPKTGSVKTFNTPYLKSSARSPVVEVLISNQIPFEIDQQLGKRLLPYLAILLPTLILIVVFVYFIMSYRRGSGLFSRSSGARKADVDDPQQSFDDVAAQPQAILELRELADFLQNPDEFRKLGARIPKGVLLYGPPGCGKTLLARAVAGESGASFYSISGSDFVEMFVGVGAARVRELFKEARENAPSIVFIDEIDSVARKRRGSAITTGGSSEEQGQALNQLLAEMDGFAPVEGTIVMAATNRPDDLDPALLRPGRFDRAISVDLPDEAGRAEILALHARSKPLAPDADLPAIAGRAYGLTGADLESVMNESALLAARAKRDDISQQQLDEALLRILEAPERQRRLTMRDRTIGQQSLDGERTTFADVAGIGEALSELTEIRDFLVDPSRYAAVGARFPHGFMLVGPPGCGKTLLARAVAGEANAAFLSVAATEFVEIFVGEGSGRVRDLFSRARALAPAIVFIDEIDAVGSRRGNSSDGGSREREQTLNQILIELDGFRPRDGVIVMAATNRPEILDPALVRAGRFDRQITISLPDRQGRQDILKVHVGSKELAPDVDLDAIAAITRGLSGADLANVMNEAALLSARRAQTVITMATMEEAVERSTLGISRTSAMTEDERQVVAVHEAGHAVVAWMVPEGQLPHMISIIPQGGALGLAWMVDTHDRVVDSQSQLIDEMAVLLAGRAAERLVFGQAGSGVRSDLARVGSIARHMVREYGMSDLIGPMGYPDTVGFAEEAIPPSEETARIMDVEARKLVHEAETRADEVLRFSRDALERVVAGLLENETLSAKAIEELIGSPAREPAPVRAIR